MLVAEWMPRDVLTVGPEDKVSTAAHILGKRRILELYLNVVEWGPGIYGAEAASRYHYATSARSLGREQAARLAVRIARASAATLQAPVALAPVEPAQGRFFATASEDPFRVPLAERVELFDLSTEALPLFERHHVH